MIARAQLRFEIDQKLNAHSAGVSDHDRYYQIHFVDSGSETGFLVL